MPIYWIVYIQNKCQAKGKPFCQLLDIPFTFWDMSDWSKTRLFHPVITFDLNFILKLQYWLGFRKAFAWESDLSHAHHSLVKNVTASQMKLKGTHLILISLSRRCYGSRQVGRATKLSELSDGSNAYSSQAIRGLGGMRPGHFVLMVRSSLKACWQLIVKLSFCLSFSSSFNKRFLLRAFLDLGGWAAVDCSPSPPARKQEFAASCNPLPMRSKGHTHRHSPYYHVHLKEHLAPPDRYWFL